MSELPGIRWSRRAVRTPDPPISWLMKHAIEHPDCISLAAGFVDSDTLPVEVTGACVRQIMSEPATARAALQYGTSQGLGSLRRQIAERLARLDRITPESHRVTADDVIVTTGSQQLLLLISEVLLDPDDIVILGAPSYFVYMGILQSMQVRVRAVPTDADGMDTDALAATLRQIEADGDLDRVKIIYCVSYFQNPMGVSLSLPRRRRLAELAQEFSRRHRIVVLEDAAYKELGFTDEVPSPIKSFDPRNEFVAFTSTFCKPFSAGLKTGYGVLPPELMTAVLRQKGNHDFGSANLPQWIISTAIARGDFDRHLQVVRAGYARKKSILAEAIRTHFPPQTRWIDPAGGLYIWAELPAAIPTGPHSEFFRRALERQVLYVPGEHCFFPAAGVEPPPSAMRLSYGVCDDTHIAEGGQRLGRLACEMLAEAKVGSGLSR